MRPENVIRIFRPQERWCVLGRTVKSHAVVCHPFTAPRADKLIMTRGAGYSTVNFANFAHERLPLRLILASHVTVRRGGGHAPA